MTSCTVHFQPLGMKRVIELHVEALERGKRFECSRLSVRMTNHADWTRSISKLFGVTACAWKVSARAGKHRLCCRAFTAMTKQAGQPRVVGVVVIELREVDVLVLRVGDACTKRPPSIKFNC